ncbi:MAG: DUF2891 domain-containing protein [Gammaproteobacteria bacterium]|nr:DUF2891 domain-containing protein [Gammaproteobacteria bacterium]MBU1554552.1 DUF2891 domain-containing protein [Gammaproteobacteria bacterium]MBU2072237.1 DUF2891 domain-containing protein [Gammaproteobacteria bacterium]MBU2182099.1 DUF2891 domain-containing protein [Gammaproteobacteria bacterium]MBU2205539.1 DUF2891 domain-containing protein [Gammaproteobacteria bacterium]
MKLKTILSNMLLLSACLAGKAMAQNSHTLNLAEANKLVSLPLHCVETPYPYKTGWVLASTADLQPPSVVHPIFYGCFDWHSAVHGYWSLVTLLRQFPDLAQAAEVKAILSRNLTADKVAQEVAFFSKDINASFERTYGWAWLLKLSDELHSWQDPMAAQLAANLQPLADLIVERYLGFLPRLLYPVRVGEHTNTAFGLSFAYDYAVNRQHTALQQLITQRAKDFYLQDKNCPISWEPSGYDFISPCLEEIGLMQRILPAEQFLLWLSGFMPQLASPDFSLAVGQVADRTDGKLVHLDGLNFSRGWNLYALAGQYPQYAHLRTVADQHLAYSYPNLIGDSYEGGHWLGSFAIHALNSAKP